MLLDDESMFVVTICPLDNDDDDDDEDIAVTPLDVLKSKHFILKKTNIVIIHCLFVFYPVVGGVLTSGVDDVDDIALEPNVVVRLVDPVVNTVVFFKKKNYFEVLFKSNLKIRKPGNCVAVVAIVIFKILLLF